MTRIRHVLATGIALIALAAMAGCAKTSQVEATGKGNIRGINAIATSPDLQFYIEERALGSVGFKTAAGYSEYDDLSYEFNFRIFLPGASTGTRLGTKFIDVVADTNYTIVIAGTVANPSIISWEAPEREWDAAETTFQADFAHLSPALGEVDVYFAASGTAPVLGNAIATIGFGDRVPYSELQAGDFELIVTPKDDPATVIFQSGSLAAVQATTVTFAIFDPDPSNTADIAVSLINATGTSATVPDARFPANFRLLHTAFGTGNVDGYLDSDFGTTVFSDVGFGELSPYADIASTTLTFSLTDAGNSGAPVHEGDINIAANTRITMILGGEPGALTYRPLRHDARPLETYPIIRLTNLSVNAEAVTVYLLEPGTVIDDSTIARFYGMPTLIDTGFFGPDAGTYELTLTLLDDLAPITPTITLDLANRDIVDIVIVDTADPAVVDLVFLDAPTVP